jgi:hypothetical protein
MRCDGARERDESEIQSHTNELIHERALAKYERWSVTLMLLQTNSCRRKRGTEKISIPGKLIFSSRSLPVAVLFDILTLPSRFVRSRLCVYLPNDAIFMISLRTRSLSRSVCLSPIPEPRGFRSLFCINFASY